jgi:hypothetical protein
MSTINLTQVAARFATLPGHASLIYFDKDTDTIISICPTPMLRFPNRLSYTFSAHRVGGPFDWEDAAKYVELAVSKFDWGIVPVGGSHDINLVPGAEQPPSVDIRTVVTNKDDSGIYHAGHLCLDISEAVFEMNLVVATLQGVIADRLAGLVKLESASPSQATKH